MSSRLLYACYCRAQVVQGASASRTTYIFGLRRAQPCRLQYGERSVRDVAQGDASVVHQPQSVGQSVCHERAHVRSRLKLHVSLLLRVVAVHLCEHNGVAHSRTHHLVHQRALLSRTVAVVAHAHHHHFRMSLQACRVFLRRCAELQHEELQRSVHERYERYGV